MVALVVFIFFIEADQRVGECRTLDSATIFNLVRKGLLRVLIMLITMVAVMMMVVMANITLSEFLKQRSHSEAFTGLLLVKSVLGHIEQGFV